MSALELACLAIVTVYLVVRVRSDEAPRQLLLRLFAMMIASFLAEDSVIRAYGFYAYAPSWSLFVDRVPIMIIFIWPIVIHSASELASKLEPAPGSRRVLITGAFVLFDAMLIEPIAVHAGLWSWSAPGFFGVPPIGVLGWAFFAASWVAFDRRPVPSLVAFVSVPITHALLLATWWILFRHLNAPIDDARAVIGAWIAALAFAIPIAIGRAKDRVSLLMMMLRLPGALFFFVLLALAPDPMLIAYAAAFPLPYLLLLPLSVKRSERTAAEEMRAAHRA